MAAHLNNWTEFPVDFQDYETEEQEYQDMIADNKIAELAETDLSLVLKDVLELGPFDFDLLGIPDFKLPEDFEPQSEEDSIPENVQTITKTGDLWILGRHRLLCGDSTNIQHVEKLMNGAKADMVFTDPPYGISFDDHANSEKQRKHTGAVSKKFGVIQNDDLDINEFVNIILGEFGYCHRIFIWGILNGNGNGNVPSGSFIVWDKKLEQQANVPHGDFDICWSKNVGWKMLRHVWGGFKNKEKGEDRYHPTQKPISLVVDFFDRWGKAEDKVVDLFGGSGTTLIACEKTNRKCFMMELDPHYCDVIVTRWEKYTGQKAILQNVT